MNKYVAYSNLEFELCLILIIKCCFFSNYFLQTPQDGNEIRSMKNAIASMHWEKFVQSRGNNIFLFNILSIFNSIQY